MSSGGSSEPGPHDAVEELPQLIKEASISISVLRNRYHKAVGDSPETSQLGELKGSTINELRNKVKTGDDVKLKFQALDELQKNFELIFPPVANTRKDIDDAASLRKVRRSLMPEIDEQKRQIEELQRQIGDKQRQIDDLTCRLQREKEDCGKAVKDRLMFESNAIKYGGLYHDLRAEYEHCHRNGKKQADKLQQVEEENKELRKLAADNQTIAQDIHDRNQSIEALNRQLAKEKENTERRNESLERQIADVEGKRSKQSGAGGVYSSSEADPTTLATAARDIKSSLATFARTLMEGMPVQVRTDFLQTHHAGITFSSRKTDIKYAFQEWAAKLVFQGLWESDSFSYNCLPVGQEVEETQEFYFNKYRQLKSTRPSDVLGRLEGSTCGQCSGVCDCGWIEFNQFFMDKWCALKDTGRDMVEVSVETATPLREDFVALLTNVWLAHLLTLAFEQPATLFKVKSGSQFVPAHMEPTMLEVEPTTDDLTVAFMIIPGFRVGKSVIKSLVYVSPIQIPGEPNDLVVNQAPSSQIAASISNDDTAQKDSRLPQRKQDSSQTHLIFKAYRIHPTKKAGSVLKMKGRDGKYYFPRVPWKEDPVSTKVDILSWMHTVGALPPGEADVLEQAKGSSDCWEMLIRYHESKLKGSLVHWEPIQDCPFGPLAKQSASAKAKQIFRV